LKDGKPPAKRPVLPVRPGQDLRTPALISGASYRPGSSLGRTFVRRGSTHRRAK
jgi:hypothetical protein